MLKRMAIALVSLCGILVATYLTLYKMGIIGTLSCSVGHCEVVNSSKWAVLVGAPVAAWGVAFYVATFVVAMLSLQPRFAGSIRISQLLLAMTGWGVLFSGWLTYLELFVIHAICIWCVASAILVAILFSLSLADYLPRRKASAPGEVAV